MCFVCPYRQQRMEDRDLIRDISTLGVWEKNIVHKLVKRRYGKSQSTVAILLPIWKQPKGNKCSKYIKASNSSPLLAFYLEGKLQCLGTHRASLILLWSGIQWTDKAASGWIGFILVRACLPLNTRCSPFTSEALCWGSAYVADSFPSGSTSFVYVITVP